MTKSILFGVAALLLSGAIWASPFGPSADPAATGAVGAAFSPSDLPIKADLASAIAADAH